MTWPRCACGCGQPAPAYKNSKPARGIFAGQPARFVKGHNARRSLADRFWQRVEKTDTCWLWIGAVNDSGYGLLTALGETLAHRVAYRLLVGPIPDGMYLDHVAASGCLHRHCVNPAHLEPVTHDENMLRSRLTHCQRGHELVGDNLLMERDVKGRDVRRCRTCRKQNRRDARRRAAATSPRPHPGAATAAPIHMSTGTPPRMARNTEVAA